jgi:drug/metabolite transporter (DMT)-like permease
MMILMANVIFGEKVAAAQWMAAFIGLAGTWLVIRPPFPGTGGWLLLLPLGMGFCFALYNVLTREMRTERTSANLFHTALWVFIALSFVMPGLAYPFPESGVAMIGIGVWGFVLLLFLDRALAWAPASLVAPFIYTQCIWGDALELIRRRFHPGLHELLGSILIMGSLAWIFAHECRSNRIFKSQQHDRQMLRS